MGALMQIVDESVAVFDDAFVAVLVRTLLATMVLCTAAHAQAPTVGPVDTRNFPAVLNQYLPSATVTATGGNTARTSADRAADVLFVKDFGAKCDGSTDDTSAIQATLTYSYNNPGSDFWGNTYAAVAFPNGVCFTETLTVQPRQTLVGKGSNSTILALKAGTNGDLLTSPALASSYNSGTAAYTWITVQGMTLDGNKSNETGTSYGVDLQDDANSFYSAGAILQDVRIINFLTDGIYAGTNRNNGYIQNSQILYSTGNGITNKSYDWFATNSSFGSNSGIGWEQVTHGCVSAVNTSFFSNGLHGIKMDSGAGCYFNVNSGSIDDNQRNGIDNESPAQISILGTRIGDNSQATTNTYANILLNNAGVFTAAAAIWQQGLTNTPNYLIQQTGTIGTVNFDPSNVVAGTPWATAQFSNSSSSGTKYAVGSNILSTTTQNSGWALTNGSHSSVLIQCTLSGCDGGKIQLLNGGSALVSLGADGSNDTINAGAHNITMTGAALMWNGPITLGSSTGATVSNGELAGTKISASGTAPGAGYAKMEWVAGTNAGTCKLIAYAGTSTTPTTIIDNVGGGC
jgi:hypothetical protein